MRRTEPEGHGPVRFGPPFPDDGLPVLPELAGVLAAAAARGGAEPVGGGATLLDAACGYGDRRGLPAVPDRTALAPGAPALLTALTAAIDGDVLVPRPCASWWPPYARLLGRPVFPVPTPAESGGVPDPYALLETVRRMRAEGRDPRLLVLSVADDPTATVAPPELLHETLEAAAGEGLHLVSDETWRDTLHDPHDTVLLSPAEMLPDRVTVVTDLAGSLLPPGWPAAVARFPAGEGAPRCTRACSTCSPRSTPGWPPPVAAAAGYALSEPEPVTARVAATVRVHARVAAAAHHAVVSAGALARPPAVRPAPLRRPHPLAPGLSERGIGDAQELEDFLTARLGMPAPGGHRFGDDFETHRVRLCTAPCWARAPRSARGAWTRTTRRNCHRCDARCTIWHRSSTISVTALGDGSPLDDAAAPVDRNDVRSGDAGPPSGGSHPRSPSRVRSPSAGCGPAPSTTA